MLISDLAVNASNEHLFYLMQKAHKHGYYVHPEFYDEYDRRAEHIYIHNFEAEDTSGQTVINMDFSEAEARVMAHIGTWDMLTKRPSRFREHVNVHGTVTGRFPSRRPNIDSSKGIKLNV